MRPPVAIILAICSLPLVACSRAAEPPAVAPQQYGGTHPNSYDSSSRPNSYERGDGNTTPDHQNLTPTRSRFAGLRFECWRCMHRGGLLGQPVEAR